MNGSTSERRAKVVRIDVDRPLAPIEGLDGYPAVMAIVGASGTILGRRS